MKQRESAINAKQVVVKFSKAIDPTTVNADRFVVTQTGDAAGFWILEG